MQTILPALLLFISGACLAMQAPTNASLAKASGSVIFAALVSFAVGTTALLAVWLWAGGTLTIRTGGSAAWMWIGGLYGAVYVAAMAYVAPLMGISAALTIALSGQIIAALVIDQFGMFGLTATPLSPERLVGAFLVLAGVILTRTSD